MRAIQITEFGGPEVLRETELPQPEPREDEVLIEVRHAGLNFADTHQRTDSYVAKAELPLVPGAEVAGIRGDTSTDSQGYGQVQVVSMRPVKSERFILIIGTKTLGLEAGEVSQIVLPGNWCSRVAMN